MVLCDPLYSKGRESPVFFLSSMLSESTWSQDQLIKKTGLICSFTFEVIRESHLPKSPVQDGPVHIFGTDENLSQSRNARLVLWHSPSFLPPPRHLKTG